MRKKKGMDAAHDKLYGRIADLLAQEADRKSVV